MPARARLLWGQRRAEPRLLFARSAPRSGATPSLTIEEAIARFADDNPAQLYRGGA
jgi:hypothetical protein